MYSAILFSKVIEVLQKGGVDLTGFGCIPEVYTAIYTQRSTIERFMIRRTTYKQAPPASLYMTHYTYNHPPHTGSSN